jgi:hypothetical protein
MPTADGEDVHDHMDQMEEEPDSIADDAQRAVGGQ